MTQSNNELEQIFERIDSLGHSFQSVVTHIDNFEHSVNNRFDQIDTRLDDLDTRLTEEVTRWDERFFQLSRDSINFTRASVATAAIVALIVPIFSDLIPVLVEQYANHP